MPEQAYSRNFFILAGIKAPRDGVPDQPGTCTCIARSNMTPLLSLRFRSSAMYVLYVLYSTVLYCTVPDVPHYGLRGPAPRYLHCSNSSAPFGNGVKADVGQGILQCILDWVV